MLPDHFHQPTTVWLRVSQTSRRDFAGFYFFGAKALQLQFKTARRQNFTLLAGEGRLVQTDWAFDSHQNRWAAMAAVHQSPVTAGFRTFDDVPYEHPHNGCSSRDLSNSTVVLRSRGKFERVDCCTNSSGGGEEKAPAAVRMFKEV
jgi:hypothetical protein